MNVRLDSGWVRLSDRAVYCMEIIHVYVFKILG